MQKLKPVRVDMEEITADFPGDRLEQVDVLEMRLFEAAEQSEVLTKHPNGTHRLGSNRHPPCKKKGCCMHSVWWSHHGYRSHTSHAVLTLSAGNLHFRLLA